MSFCCYFIYSPQYETTLKPTHGNGNMSSFVSLNPFRPRWHRCPWTFHWLRFGLCWWTTEFGFSTLGTAGDCLWTKEQTRDSTTKTLDSTTKGQQPKKMVSTTNRFSLLVVESELDRKLRIIMNYEDRVIKNVIFLKISSTQPPYQLRNVLRCGVSIRFFQQHAYCGDAGWWSGMFFREAVSIKSLQQNHSEMKCNSTSSVFLPLQITS